MSASGVISFRILTGPHMGAELVLPAGALLIGSDDSCDVILQDSSVAPRHVRLDIAAEGPSVRVTPLDKTVLAGGEPVPAEGAELPPATPCQLGLSCLAWISPDEDPEAWTRVLAEVQAGRNAASPERADASSLSAAAQDDARDAGSNAGQEADEAIMLPAALDANAVGATAASRPPGDRLRRTLTLLVALLCLCGLVFSYAGRSPDPEKRAEQVQELVASSGFGGLRAVPMGQGVAVLGVVGSDAERATLLNLARNVHYPVYLDLVVRGDRVEALRAAFHSRGFFPRVDEEDGRLRAALYVKDGLAEEWAFSSVRDDVPGLRDQAAWDALERVVRHAADVEPVLRRALKEAGLEFVGIRFLNGQVELAGEFDSDQQRRLSETLDAVSAELGVPVTFSVVPSFARADAARGRTSFVPEQEPRPVAAPESAADPLGGTQVTGVTLSPMKFISLSNGQRIFEGGLLPGGYTLDGIDVRVLTLRKGGQTLQYPLRGAQDE